MYTFLSNLRTYLDRHGIPFTKHLADEYDFLFVNSFMVPYRWVRRAKRRRPHLRVVQRVDGSGRDYGRWDDADARQARINTIADLTIFQSSYGKYATTEKFKIMTQDGPIIYNPVDIDTFRPTGKRLDLPGRVKVCYVTFSTNARKGAASLYAVIETNPEIDFFLVGNYNDAPTLPNVHILGILDRETLAEALRGCDLYLTFSENDTCPNTVLEALASGLPVLYKDSGGAAELVGPCGFAVTKARFKERLEAVLARRRELSEAARARAEELFAPEAVFPQYLTALGDTQRRPFPRYTELVRWRLQGYPVLFNPITSAKQWGAQALRCVRSHL